MPFDAISGPGVKLLLQIGLGGFGLQAQRIAGEIDDVFARVLRHVEACPHSAQRVGKVLRPRVIQGVGK